MKYNEFGKTGMYVSEIGFGGSRIGGVFAGRDSVEQALNVLRKALDSGITFYDTADMYAQGESESLIGAAFRGRREHVIIATKGGYCLPAQRDVMRRIKPLVRPIVRALRLKRTSLPAAISGTLSQDFSPLYLTKALEASLKRLQTDYIDLYQLHSPGAQFMQSNAFEETLLALEKLKTQGKVRFYGVATEVPADAPFCLSASGISSVQLGFGLLDPEALDRGTLAAATARGLGIIARGCFGGGLLKDGLEGAQLKAATPKWQRIETIRSLSKDMRRSALDAALQFCRGTPGLSITLLGMRIEDHLRENLRYVQASRLNPEEYSVLRNLPS
jgi:aryl-alcohol dehydrogenase-like predicted oxidoreductase